MTPYSPITTHVLNTALGVPGRNVPISLHYKTPGSEWVLVKQGYFNHYFTLILLINYLCYMNKHRNTNDDGRLPHLLTTEEFKAGLYKMTFDTETYFKELNTSTFYPHVKVDIIYLFKFLFNLSYIIF